MYDTLMTAFKSILPLNQIAYGPKIIEKNQ